MNPSGTAANIAFQRVSLVKQTQLQKMPITVILCIYIRDRFVIQGIL